MKYREKRNKNEQKVSLQTVGLPQRKWRFSRLASAKVKILSEDNCFSEDENPIARENASRKECDEKLSEPQKKGNLPKERNRSQMMQTLAQE